MEISALGVFTLIGCFHGWIIHLVEISTVRAFILNDFCCLGVSIMHGNFHCWSSFHTWTFPLLGYFQILTSIQFHG